MLKKVLSICAAMVMGLCVFCGCKLRHLSLFDYYDGNFFDEEHLAEHLIPDLPQPKDAKVIKDYGSEIHYEMSEETIEKYAREVYDYIVSCNFQRLGTPGSIYPTASDSAVHECTEYEGFKHENTGSESILYEYIFCWANKRVEKDEDRWVSHFLRVELCKDDMVAVSLCDALPYPLRESSFYPKETDR